MWGTSLTHPLPVLRGAQNQFGVGPRTSLKLYIDKKTSLPSSSLSANLYMFLATIVNASIWALGLSSVVSAFFNTGIYLSPCADPSPPRECGRFEVPLDYHNVSAGNAQLAVIRFNATKTTRLGTLFVNPGGPGELNFGITGRGHSLSAILG
jgi:hypothetical protein